MKTPLRAALVALTLAAAACSESSEAAPASTPDATAADLLGSVRDPGAGMQSSLPVAGGSVQRQQELDLDALGYNDGEAGAPVRVLEFSDFGCGYCRKFHLESYPILVEEYMDAGKVEWKYVPMVSGMFENSLAVTRLAECAGEQGRWPEARDLIFERQPEWKSADDPARLARGYGEELGLDMAQLDSCLAEGRREERIENGTLLSRQVGVRGTPTFFVVGYAPIPGAVPLELFREVLDTVYVEATRPEAGGG